MTLPSSIPELLKLRQEIGRVLSRLRRAEKPQKSQTRKPPKISGDKEAWRTFTKDHPRCWNCNRGPTERMHFVHARGVGYKINDVRLVIASCRRCHDNSHSPCSTYPYPLLTFERCAWLKREHDEANYDPEFIKANNRNRAIEPEEYRA